MPTREDEGRPLLDDYALKKRYGEKSGNSEVEKLQRKELVRGVARRDETSDRLDRTYKMAGNANNIGDEILLKLQGQREKILSARASAEYMEGDMDVSERKMARMACEKCIQRWILWLIVILVVGGLLFFLYYKLELEGHKNDVHVVHHDVVDSAPSPVVNNDDRMAARTRRLLIEAAGGSTWGDEHLDKPGLDGAAL